MGASPSKATRASRSLLIWIIHHGLVSSCSDAPKKFDFLLGFSNEVNLRRQKRGMMRKGKWWGKMHGSGSSDRKHVCKGRRKVSRKGQIRDEEETAEENK